MNNDLIRRSDLLAKKCMVRGHLDTGSPCPSKVTAIPVDVIERAPAVDAVVVRHGRWDGGYTKTSDGEWVYSMLKCTVCGSKSNGGTTNFCPYCGCKMLEDSDGKK